MARETIALDVDNVISDEDAAVRQHIFEQFGLPVDSKEYEIEAPYGQNWFLAAGLTEEQAIAFYQPSVNLAIKQRHLPIPGAAEGLAVLNEHFDLVIVTSREDYTVDLTHEWLKRHIPNVFKEIEFKALWSNHPSVTKAIICQALKASYLVDDRLDHCNIAAEAGIESLLFGNYPWNRAGDLADGVTRVSNWPAVLEYFGV
ncbi:MAG TPA: hypothetical protein VFB03_00955 [Candidatus Saccharimonadales bacterium]|nr:hypothetical protein [Candidatus Saccharimonadales bacterium]